MTRRGLAAGAVCLLLGGGVACGVASAGQPSAGQPEIRTIEITMRHSRFEPGEIVVDRGATVRFVVRNLDPIDHEFIVGDEVVQQVHERGTEAHHPPKPGEMSVPAGGTAVTTYVMPEEAGGLLIGCHLPGHWAYGMRAEVQVR